MDWAELYRRLEEEIQRAERAVAAAQRIVARARALQGLRSGQL
ncbi:hypothetical protein [Dactylosporangium aurantiacum]|nr:hypothetical protein [Dactylosporangium aurantiacum]MDG6105781.1 hypothetical protein [Dactylosporangium aurantiacum]